MIIDQACMGAKNVYMKFISPQQAASIQYSWEKIVAENSRFSPQLTEGFVERHNAPGFPPGLQGEASAKKEFDAFAFFCMFVKRRLVAKFQQVLAKALERKLAYTVVINLMLPQARDTS